MYVFMYDKLSYRHLFIEPGCAGYYLQMVISLLYLSFFSLFYFCHSLKIALLDGISPSPLLRMGLEIVDVEKNPNILICRGSSVDKEQLTACAGLKMVIRAGAGYNNIDVKTASELDIAVCNTPGQNAIAVSELVFGLILSLDRRIQESNDSIEKGIWDKVSLSKRQRGLFSRTLGVIGCGNIGQQVIRRAAAFGMNVNVWSKRYDNVKEPIAMSREEASQIGLDWCLDLIDIIIMPSVLSVAKTSDVMTVHVQPSEETKHLICAEILEAMPNNAILINTAREDVLDMEALLDYCSVHPEKKLRFGLDVWRDENVDAFAEGNARLIDLMNREGDKVILGTPHIGASTNQAQEAVVKEMLKVVSTYVDSGIILNRVN